ncbi:MAG: hypothetical protein C4518_06745 [Desulfobacteraceae bacterium]|nr:MAG: hypothetical protein C4518_06745 [Desulfobacteraceae bacterium]
MKQYVIDELRPADQEKIKEYLDAHFGPADMGAIYWIPIEASVYNDTQTCHASCHPLYFALELSEAALTIELLVRTKNKIRCDCICYATEDQFLWLLRVVDAIFERLEIKT